ncbi:mas-related G-protein coupled receptor member H-like [Hemicordylus capensis]|uniref:mas-related G-protein coupled receptor member H-like n=1 Tax=Hemicordylus capensis TaxID=884348 RepID=UPI0023037350|nr:mas-related G-protein coupled receptor member H-like [Hemicordylus capensis]
MEYKTTSEETWKSDNDTSRRESPEIYRGSIEIFLTIFICVICTFGLAGNGIVIWLLGFRIKRNPFTTYILNLAVADFGLLLILVLWIILHTVLQSNISMTGLYFSLFFIAIYVIGHLLLTAISVDRCVSVLCPIWYRCHRPPHCSTFICVVIWVLSFAFNGIPTILLSGNFTELANFTISFQFHVNAFLCLPLITISSLILFIRVCFKSRQHRRGRILIVVLLTLLFYLFFAFPLTALIVTVIYFHFLSGTFIYYADFVFLSTSLNSSVNPFIYFLVGRMKRSCSRESMKVTLQRVFKEEEVPEAEEEPPLETQL